MYPRCWIAALILAGVSMAAQAEPLVLRNPQWTVEVDPSTLKLVAIPLAGPRIVAPPGRYAHRVSGLRYVHDGVGWVWDEGAWQFQLRLQDHEVLLWMRQGEDGEATLRRLTMHGVDQPTSPLADAAGQQNPSPAPLHLGQEDEIELAALHPLTYRRALRPPTGQAIRPAQD